MVVGELAHERDLVIIGGGPGGYHAAIRAAQLGVSVTLVDKDELGGVCLNKGCIPSKVITQGADRFLSFQKSAILGIEHSNLRFNMKNLQEYQKNKIKQLRHSVFSLCRANKVEVIKGSAFFLSEDTIGIESEDAYEVYRFKHAVIAAGSSPKKLNGISVDHVRIVDSWSISNLQIVPEKLLVYGCDYIALEMAMAYNALGSQVELIFSQKDFPFDSTINRELKRTLKKSGIKVIQEKFVLSAETQENEVTLLVRDLNDEKFTGTHLFVSSGFSPNTKNLGIERIGIELTKEGFIKVNNKCQTSVNHIYAIGDITAGPSLAVKAIKQGKIAAEVIAGKRSELDLNFLPTIAHTNPPIASVGLTEEEAIEQGYLIKAAQYSLAGNGFAEISGKKEGVIKVIFDEKHHLLLGIHIIGFGAVELISSGIFALEMAARDEDLIFPFYPHPSINEVLQEATESLYNQAIHFSPKMNKK